MITLFHKFAFKTQCSSDNIAVKWETSMSVDLLYQSCDVISEGALCFPLFIYDFVRTVMHINSSHYYRVIQLYESGKSNFVYLIFNDN